MKTKSPKNPLSFYFIILCVCVCVLHVKISKRHKGWPWMVEEYSKPCQTSTMELFAKILLVKKHKSDVWQGSEYVSEWGYK